MKNRPCWGEPPVCLDDGTPAAGRLIFQHRYFGTVLYGWEQFRIDGGTVHLICKMEYLKRQSEQPTNINPVYSTLRLFFPSICFHRVSRHKKSRSQNRCLNSPNSRKCLVSYTFSVQLCHADSLRKQAFYAHPRHSPYSPLSEYAPV